MKFGKRTAVVGAGLLMSTGLAMAAPAVVEENLNMRAGPGVGFPVIAVLPAGATVEMGGCTGSWCQVLWGGAQGYASRRYMALAAPGTAFAAATNPIAGAAAAVAAPVAGAVGALTAPFAYALGAPTWGFYGPFGYQPYAAYGYYTQPSAAYGYAAQPYQSYAFSYNAPAAGYVYAARSYEPYGVGYAVAPSASAGYVTTTFAASPGVTAEGVPLRAERQVRTVRGEAVARGGTIQSTGTLQPPDVQPSAATTGAGTEMRRTRSRGEAQPARRGGTTY